MSVTELRRIVAGHLPRRESADDITLFRSLGIAILDVAAAFRGYTLAREQGIGEDITFWSGSP